MIKTRKLSKKDISKKGLVKIINRDITEINNLTDEEITSVWAFFKCLCSKIDDEVVFVTLKDSIVNKSRAILEKNTKVKIKTIDEVMAG